MAKKKKAKAVNSRVAEHRARMRENGYRQVAVLLPTATIAKLDKLAKLSNEPRATVIDLLIQDGASRLAAKQDPQPTKKKAPAKKKTTRKKRGNCSLCGQYRPDSELKELGRGANRYKGAQCIDFVECNRKRGIIN